MRTAPLLEPSAFPDAAAFTRDPVPWDGRTRMRAEREALAHADAALAGDAPLLPRLVVWTWERPTISLGFLQDGSEVVSHDLPVVRRPTGGGAILHDVEWTWGALVPLDHPRLGGPLAAATRAITAVFAAALARAFGIVVDPPAPEPHRGGSGAAACFARTFGHELAVGGRKLMGSAQRRGRRAFLQQGSLLVGPGHERLARHLRTSEPDAERTLARRAVTLEELLGHRPEVAPFADALAEAWRREAGGHRAEGSLVSSR